MMSAVKALYKSAPVEQLPLLPASPEAKVSLSKVAATKGPPGPSIEYIS